MKSRVATCLLLCVLAAGLVSASTLESNRLPSFLEFVSNAPVHVFTLKGLMKKITPSKKISPRVYIAAYKSLSPKAQKKISKKYHGILRVLKLLTQKKGGSAKKGSKKGAKKPTTKPAAIKPTTKPAAIKPTTKPAAVKPTPKTGQKILRPTVTAKTNAQKGAIKRSKAKSWRTLTTDEQKQVKAGIAKEKASRRAKLAAKRAARKAARAAKRAAKKAAKKDGTAKVATKQAAIKKTPIKKVAKKAPKVKKPKLTKEQKVAAWNKLTSQQKVDWSVRRYFKTKKVVATIAKGVLAWKKLKSDKRAKLIKEFGGKKAGKKPKTGQKPKNGKKAPVANAKVGVQTKTSASA